MKKSLLAVAVLGAFAGTAMAADVTLYGRIDTGLEYVHTKFKPHTGDKVKTNKFNMMSGRNTGSRWGLKGTEELGNGYKVGFILESGFNSDTGNQSVAGKLFNREAVIFVDGGFGRLYAGRQGDFTQGQGSVALIGGLSAFSTSYGDYAAHATSTFAAGSNRDNTLSYVSPKFAGFGILAQYSFGDDGVENKSNNTYKLNAIEKVIVDGEKPYLVDAKADRHAGLAATYDNGPLKLMLIGDYVWYGHDNPGKDHGYDHDVDDALTVTFGGSYDFGVAKVYGGVQYFDEVKATQLKWNSDLGSKNMEGWGVNVSASIPVWGGTALAGVAYMDAETADSVKAKSAKYDAKRIRATVGYVYPFSKRTQVYVAAGYGHDEQKMKEGGAKNKLDYGTAMFGLRHDF